MAQTPAGPFLPRAQAGSYRVQGGESRREFLLDPGEQFDAMAAPAVDVIDRGAMHLLDVDGDRELGRHWGAD